MSGRFLTDLAQVVRNAGLAVFEDPGWQTRSRSSGGFANGQPSGLLVHHTASGPGSDGQSDVNFIARNSSIRPVYNCYVDRTGRWWIIAAGAANHGGRGGPVPWAPKDRANTHALSVSGANAGTGEAWPSVQTSSILTGVGALCVAYKIPPENVIGHFEWTTRKIDPWGPSPWGQQQWSMAAFRAALIGGPLAPTSPRPLPYRPFPGTARLGNRGAYVLAWQQEYIRRGVIKDTASNRDAYYGPGMESATRRLQRSWGWSDADGVAGTHTWAHLSTKPCSRCGRG